MENLAIFCADVGSIRQKKFGWAAKLPNGKDAVGSSIEEFAASIAGQIKINSKVAIGFECPLYVPVRDNPLEVNSARNGEGNRSWSAGAGTGALATGLVEVLWVMRSINPILGKPPQAVFQWDKFVNSESVCLWEAFVSSSSKGVGHSDDAKIATEHFKSSLPNPSAANAINESNVLSLVGAAALHASWTSNILVLSEPCLVIKA